jgi:hypothetical protein
MSNNPSTALLEQWIVSPPPLLSSVGGLRKGGEANTISVEAGGRMMGE